MYISTFTRRLNTLFKLNESYKKYSVIAAVLKKPTVGKVTEIKGWVKNLRKQKDLIFADVSDGSCAQKLQIVIPKALATNSLTYGSSVHITDGYPFNPRTTHPPEYTRQYLHLRTRTNYMAAILRVRSSLTKHIHDYYTLKKYTNINTPILTSNDSEGAGEVFKLQPDNEETVKAMMQENKDRDSVYFGSKTFLTVSGQLHLEAACRGMGDVYTLGPTFRAENSRSRLHLSEFYMLEAELAFCKTIEQLQLAIEELIKYIFVNIRNTNEADLFLIDKKNVSPTWIDKQFITITYDEARQILQKKGTNVADEGINKEQELTLVEHCDGVPVFVIKWPKDMKSFYMKECEEDKTKVDALDLLTPITGEVVGGSLREDDYKKLKLKLPSEKLNWYLELRKFGNIPTGGYGLGLERLLQVLCNVHNIKDTIPFPRWPHNCDM
ncbi:unnamed protein product [Arctia plantaginis]|uniref:asparagine--tRNA ligase n=1 Tax=Arctia plantaginis TaxID=874455 RepID=A0A8S1A726_ARCPL|nr:unnamed protein product [Arctia plantaginis]